MRGSAPACLAKTNTVAPAKAPRLDFCAGHVMGHIIGQRVRRGKTSHPRRIDERSLINCAQSRLIRSMRPFRSQCDSAI
jgi:hypothetical protein